MSPGSDASAAAGVDTADLDLVLYHGSECKDHIVWSAAADIADRLGAETACASESYALCAGQPLSFRQVAAQVETGDVVLFLAAGTGYTWAASVLRWVD